MRTVWAVSLEPAPEMTGTSTTSLTACTSSTFSSMWVVGDSPVVPLTTRPSAPSATSCFASFCAASKSTEPSAFMGVTMAGRIRPKGAGSRRCIVPSVIVSTVLPATDAEAFTFVTIPQYELPHRDQNPPVTGRILPLPSLPQSKNSQSLEESVR